MKTLFSLLLVLFSLAALAQDPVIQDYIDQVSLDNLEDNLREYSGEDSCTVYGMRELIRNRVSNSGNDLAADYVKERFEWYGLDVVDDQYSQGGRNIYAVQTGIINPDSIYIICGHYDAVTNYCADDNASGIIAILEIARILSKSCFVNTIVYAAWDEEEIGLRGSKFYADAAAANGDRILGVLNLDMMAYDGDDDTDYDIDLNLDSRSEAIRDVILTATTDYSLNLIPNVVQPGTFGSDHASFWRNDYGAVLLGEAWSNGDVTPGYHNSNDRINLLNFPYYHELTKLSLAYMATVAEPLGLDVSVTAGSESLTANAENAQYQWIRCSDPDVLLNGQTSQLFTPTETGNYAVIVSNIGCSDTSDCIPFEVIVSEVIGELRNISIHPIPSSNLIQIDLGREFVKCTIELFTISGTSLDHFYMQGQTLTMDLSPYPGGIYFIRLDANGHSGTFKVVKQ